MDHCLRIFSKLCVTAANCGNGRPRLPREVLNSAGSAAMIERGTTAGTADSATATAPSTPGAGKHIKTAGATRPTVSTIQKRTMILREGSHPLVSEAGLEPARPVLGH